VPFFTRLELNKLAVWFFLTDPVAMFPHYSARSTKNQVDAELAAHGVRIVEVEEFFGVWPYNSNSRFPRRITAETEMLITSPAARDELMATSAARTKTGEHNADGRRELEPVLCKSQCHADWRQSRQHGALEA